jgi:hypothetical protein
MASKKGSMELGVNAIVVLIIALVILGLAIAFVTNLFRGGGDKLGQIIDNTQIAVQASSTEPIKFETSKIFVKQGKTKDVKVSVYNNGFANANDMVRPTIKSDCQDFDGFEVPGFALNTQMQRISPGSNGAYVAVLKAPGIRAGTYICTVEMEGGSNYDISGQIHIEITL